jgi:hypothetical protein
MGSVEASSRRIDISREGEAMSPRPDVYRLAAGRAEGYGACWHLFVGKGLDERNARLHPPGKRSL